eukprot:8092746-Alexandrium_andersonii.AAC.1
MQGIRGFRQKHPAYGRVGCQSSRIKRRLRDKAQVPNGSGIPEAPGYGQEEPDNHVLSIKCV